MRIVKPISDRAAVSTRGFAVVIALGLMAFVLLLLLTITTLVQIESTVSASQKQQTLAKQNALFGMQIALGQLQKEMGPDRRISATASLLDTDPETEAIEGVGQPYWTGVWESLNWDRASQLDTPVSSLPNASDGKPASFRAWLVSGFSDPLLTAEQRIAAARSFTPASADAVQLLGEGTLGTAALAQTQSVYVKRESIRQDTASLQESGYAYWVGDEGVKARFGNPVVAEPETNEEKLYAVSAMRRPNLQALEGWGDFSGALSSVEKVFDYGGLKATAIEDLEELAAFDGKYHSVTPYSSGLLTDVRMGGFKKDLSLLFSGDELPDEYEDEPMFEIGNAVGVNWSFAKLYHDRYKFLEKEADGTAYFDPLVFEDEMKPEVEWGGSPDTTTLSGVVPAPKIIRFQYVFTFFKGYNTIDGRPLPDDETPSAEPGIPLHSDDQIVYLMITPIVYIWNPYNVAIHMNLIEDGHSALNLLPGEPPIEISVDGGASYVRWNEIFSGFQGEMLSMSTSNTDRGNGGFVIPPGQIYINTLTNHETVGGALLRRGSLLSAPNLQGVFGEEHINKAMTDGLFNWFSRRQYMVEGYDPGRMGFYTPVLKPFVPGGEIKDRKLLANGSAQIRIRATTPANSGDLVKFLFKTSLGGEEKVDKRLLLGMSYMKADGVDTPSFLSEEYIFPEVLNLATSDVPSMFDDNDEFRGATAHFSLYYDLRVFEESEQLGMPGLFSDSANGYYYSSEADRKSVSMAPYRLYFETLAGDNLIEYPPNADPSDNLAALRNTSNKKKEPNNMRQIQLRIHSFFLACLCVLAVNFASAASELESVKSAQEGIQGTTQGFVQQLKPILLELVELGASQEDVLLIQQTMGELTQLSDEEMAAILQTLSAALTQSDATVVNEKLESAFKGQSKVVEGLRTIFERLRSRQTELTIATKAEELRRRQAENQHRTEMLDEGEGDAVSAEAEQRALEDAVEELVRELEAIQGSAEQEGTEAPAVEEETLEKMRALAEEASQQMEDQDYDQAAQSQKELGEMLADLAAETGLEQSSEEFLEDLVQQLKALLVRQIALQELNLAGGAVDQERVAIETETLRIPTENVNAPAGFQVAAAAKAMRRALVALSADPVATPETGQFLAIQSLKRAIELLEDSLEEISEEDSSSSSSGDEMTELANMYRQAENLQNRQNQQNGEGGSESNQAQIARETADLQQEVAESSPEAARSLGRAAARMAEALDPDLEEGEREEIEEAAAEQLASAVEAIQAEGRARRNSPPGQGSGGQSMESIVLDDELLAPSELNPADRAAIESARREPVAVEYAPLVESYFDNLSRQSGEGQ